MLAAVLPAAPAAAQQRHRSILEMIFGNGGRQIEQQRPAVRERPVRPRPVRRSRPKKAAPTAAAAAATRAPVSAAENDTTETTAPAKTGRAEKILVVGDFMADAVAKGLTTAYADNGEVVVKSRVNGSSGLVRADFYDWPAQLGGMTRRGKARRPRHDDRIERPVSRSTTDRASIRCAPTRGSRPMTIGSARSRRSPRITAFRWCGSACPSFKFDRMSEDMVFLNDSGPQGNDGGWRRLCRRLGRLRRRGRRLHLFRPGGQRPGCAFTQRRRHHHDRCRRRQAGLLRRRNRSAGS